MDKKMNFKDLNEEEILKIVYKLWKESTKEYKVQEIEKEHKKIISEAMKYRLYHCKITGKIVLDKCKELKIQQWRILYFAALTHDIKKFHDNHSIVGGEWLEKNVEKFVEIERRDLKLISFLVKYHKKSNRCPIKNDIKFIKMLQLLIEADKLSKKIEKMDAVKT